MTQYAKQGNILFYGREDTILPGKYECIGCEYLLEPVFKNGIFSHFKHSANSRHAHQVKYGELCVQMSTDFSDTTKALDKAKKYNESTMKQLLEQAETGALQPLQVIGHLRVLESLVQNRASVQAEYRAINLRQEELDKREQELDDREEELDNYYFSIVRQEKDLKLLTDRQKRDLDKQELELNRRALNKELQRKTGKNLLEELKNTLDRCPPWQQHQTLDERLESYIYENRHTL